MDKLETVKVAGGADYAMVVTRIHSFVQQHANGQILTEIVKDEDGVVVFKAHAVIDGIIRGTGHAMEREGSNNINKTSHYECAETSAIGRCLAMIGYMPSGAIASYEEVENAKLQQSKIKEHELTLTSASLYISQALQSSINSEDEEGILEVLEDFKGNTPLKTAVWKTLSAEQAEFMTERAKVLAEEKKAKSEDKLALNKKLAKDFAEKQKAK
tara:strand:- start:173 stop:814 length:642 start_codon:yes stop_codon:yes gene_type:complete